MGHDSIINWLLFDGASTRGFPDQWSEHFFEKLSGLRCVFLTVLMGRRHQGLPIGLDILLCDSMSLCYNYHLDLSLGI